ncbi:regulator of G protein signaling superfamily [Cystobasidium minutum MCA 4210]|uniref:regulator of G protein signaling superfamily n=1 Tax=Cystobasidium minutum MCA 4210 TaxID=1397322 RepID=UPI0034CF22E8|eukprot:jgi/Rhomi1/2653/CE2652_1089
MAAPKQSSSSHMLKTGKRGNPFCKDTHDLFATLVVSLNLTTNTRFFRSYPNTFTTDDAAANLSSLRFSQSNRSTDPNDPQRIITTTTTTTFTMSREIAKGICQQFMDARLIESAIDPANPIFKDRGIYAITPKGLHVLERFITRNGIAADHLVKVFTSQPICMRLLHLERRPHDDDIIVTKPVLEGVFRRFVGHKHPNYILDPAEATRALQAGQLRIFVETVSKPIAGFDRANGVEMQDVVERITGTKTNSGLGILKYVFSSAGAIDWLCDFSTCCSRDEAAEILAHFVRFKFITLAIDRSRGDGLPIQGPAKGQVEAEFRWGPRVTYRLTDEGRRLASWDSLSVGGKSDYGSNSSLKNKTSTSADSVGEGGEFRSGSGPYPDASHNGSTHSLNAPHHSSSNNASTTIGGEWTVAGGVGVGNALDAVFNKMSFKDVFDLDLLSSDYSKWAGGEGSQHSSTTRLRAILEDIRLRAYFRDFLKNNYCEENLGFWLDVQDFRRRFATTSSASSSSLPSSSSEDGSAKKSHSHQSNPSTAHTKKPLLRGIASLGGFGSSSSSNSNSAASTAMESHQQDINIAAVNIYRTYLAPQSPSELNIDHNLRADVVNFIQKCADEAGIPASALAAPMTLLPGAGSAAPPTTLIPPTSIPSPSASPDPNSVDAASAAAAAAAAAALEKQVILPLRATQVQTLLRYYERIQDHIFRLLATDQVPRFIRTPEFMALLKAASGQDVKA